MTAGAARPLAVGVELGIAGSDGLGSGAPPAALPSALVVAAARAEALGFDAVWLGGPLAAAALVAAAIGTRTGRVRIGASIAPGAGVDPLCLAEDWATVDAITAGRLDLVAVPRAGSGFRESLELLLALWRGSEVTWSGSHRPPLERVTVEPRPTQAPHAPIWLGWPGPRDCPPAGDPGEAASWAAALGLPLLLDARAAELHALAELGARYRERWVAAGHSPAAARIGARHRVHRGAPAEVAERIEALRDAVGLDLLVAVFEAEGLPPAAAARSCELFAAEVLPALRAAAGGSSGRGSRERPDDAVAPSDPLR
jgi:alkanesulfonate monooxygenase SsuD/methylene tetrahydromethanopterin reductase-like flavin-dependent oxidoreductase (luciferase family)